MQSPVESTHGALETLPNREYNRATNRRVRSTDRTKHRSSNCSNAFGCNVLSVKREYNARGDQSIRIALGGPARLVENC
jgi:hypothetical protein